MKYLVNFFLNTQLFWIQSSPVKLSTTLYTASPCYSRYLSLKLDTWSFILRKYFCLLWFSFFCFLFCLVGPMRELRCSHSPTLAIGKPNKQDVENYTFKPTSFTEIWQGLSSAFTKKVRQVSLKGRKTGTCDCIWWIYSIPSHCVMMIILFESWIRALGNTCVILKKERAQETKEK